MFSVAAITNSTPDREVVLLLILLDYLILFDFWRME